METARKKNLNFKFTAAAHSGHATSVNQNKIPASDMGVNRSMVSADSVAVVKRLQGAGYDGYLVGGCVRDLLLGFTPKDFDVSTNASPEQVKSLFPRSRIIGRRFKLVHIIYGRGRFMEVIEVATYRAAPSSNPALRSALKTSHTGRLLDDNIYGTLEDDVVRRDFTVNALYYDPLAEMILDYVNAIDDINQRRLRMIGVVQQRFTEDPVRMLRAIRFQAKLNLKADAEITQGIARNHHLFMDVPPARMFEEVLKLFHHGAAVATWKQLSSTELVWRIFPQTMKSIEAPSGHRLEQLILLGLKNTDSRINQGLPIIPAFLYAVLLWRSYQFEMERQLVGKIPRNEAHWSAADKVFKIQTRTVAVPLRAKSPAIDIWELQFALENRIPRKIDSILANRRFRAAYDFLYLRAKVGEVEQTLVDWWTQIQELDGAGKDKMIEQLRQRASSHAGAHRGDGAKKKRRKKRSQTQSSQSALGHSGH